MVDKILFRAKQTGGSDKWVYGFYVEAETLDKSGIEYFIIEKSADGESHLVAPETVGQYTGLTDKNGTKIFEGDICKHRSNYSDNTVISTVIYADGHFLALVNEHSGFELSEKLEVIGNIHDTPELLKGGADNE